MVLSAIGKIKQDKELDFNRWQGVANLNRMVRKEHNREGLKEGPGQTVGI